MVQIKITLKKEFNLFVFCADGASICCQINLNEEKYETQICCHYSVFLLRPYLFPFIVSCRTAANSPPSFVYPTADKRNCRNVILKYIYLASDALSL